MRAGVGANTLNPPVVVSGAGLAGPCFDIQTSDDIKVQNFRITNCSLAGVRFRSSNQVLVLANRIINIPDASGVEAISGTDAQVSSNLIALTGVNGVLLDSTETSTIADNFIVRSGREGILTNGANNSRIDNNDIRQSGLEGIAVAGASTEARIERNSFQASGGASDILVGAGSIDADIVGNVAPGGITDLGVGTELANNF